MEDERLSSKYLAESYDDLAMEMAKCISKIGEIKERCEYFSSVKMDNADPAIETSNALEKLATSLACMVIYAHEYAEEAKQQESKKADSKKED